MRRIGNIFKKASNNQSLAKSTKRTRAIGSAALLLTLLVPTALPAAFSQPTPEVIDSGTAVPSVTQEVSTEESSTSESPNTSRSSNPSGAADQAEGPANSESPNAPDGTATQPSESTKVSTTPSPTSSVTEKRENEEGTSGPARISESPSDPTAKTETEPTPNVDEAEEEEPAMGILAAGPDGANAPYIHWNVVDTAGNPVPGATFDFQSRNYPEWWDWFAPDWIGQRSITDCVTGNCSGVDRDNDGGEFLAKWLGSNNPGTNPSGGTQVIAGNRYRVRPVNPPTGYVWESSTNWVDSNSRSWQGSGNNRTLDFGTFVVRKVEYGVRCEAGYVYGVSANGQIQQVAPNGTLTNIGSTASGTSSFNGLGIGQGGGSIYGYERTNDERTATIYRYDTTTGTWSSTGDSVNSTQNSRTVQFVGGAVSLDTGNYYLGGFNTNGTRFRIWEYVPGASSVTYKGEIDTSSGAGGANNGDMAFDSAGNMFVVRGSGATTTVFSITADNLAAGTGGTIPSSQAASVQTMDNVNGVAFDASGRAYLGSGTTIRSYAMPNWSDSTNVITSGFSSTDLATCSSPPTITIEKVIEGERVNTTDQFTLRLNQGSTEIATATTSGTESGLQEQRIGPIPTVRNVQLNFSEIGAGTTNLNNYASSYRCTLDGEQIAQGNGTSGSLTIPPSGQDVDCVFYNSPLIAHVNVSKAVTDIRGENPQPREDWTVGATASATNGTVTSTPSNATQETNASGTATWNFRFGGQTHHATLNISEQMEDGYEFNNGRCTITPLDGISSTVDLEGPEATALPGVKPGDRVDCLYTNSPSPDTLTVKKDIVDFAVDGDNFTIAAHNGGLHGDLIGEATTTGDNTGIQDGAGEIVGPETVVLGADGGNYVLSETGAEDTLISNYAASYQCVDANNSGAAGISLTGDLELNDSGQYFVDLGVIAERPAENKNRAVECVITNTPKPQLTLIKVVDNPDLGTGYADATDWVLTATSDDDSISGVTESEAVTNQFVDEGTYALTEAFGTTPDKSAGYQWTDLVCVDAAGDPVAGDAFSTTGGDIITSGSLALKPQDDVTCTYTNTPILGSVIWEKVDQNGDRLIGSEWSLGGPGTDDPTTVTDESENGEFLVEDLYWGDYTLQESKAPAGYVLDEGTHGFTIGYDNLAHSFDAPFVNEPREGPDLPLTGGLGRDFFTILGLSVLFLGISTAGAVMIRNHRKGVA